MIEETDEDDNPRAKKLRIIKATQLVEEDSSLSFVESLVGIVPRLANFRSRPKKRNINGQNIWVAKTEESHIEETSSIDESESE